MDSIYLQGSEDVRAAGFVMREAAQEMKNAASSIEFSLQQHQRFMDDWLQRLEQVFTEHGGTQSSSGS